MFINIKESYKYNRNENSKNKRTYIHRKKMNVENYLKIEKRH